ncbi:hypothetical protein K439DRAFT_1649744 [Ramaria rubella]|nr:hypothetical protein K439DRAFT_1649744 [Ramaria rubella]
MEIVDPSNALSISEAAVTATQVPPTPSVELDMIPVLADQPLRQTSDRPLGEHNSELPPAFQQANSHAIAPPPEASVIMPASPTPTSKPLSTIDPVETLQPMDHTPVASPPIAPIPLPFVSVPVIEPVVAQATLPPADPLVPLALSSPSPPSGDASRPLNVSDALGYLDAVKNKFHNNPDVYNNFLEIMKDFKSQRIDTPGVIERVSTLFTGHPALIQGFNTFLPPGYRIECSMDPEDVNMIRVTTPQGTMTQSTTVSSTSRVSGSVVSNGISHPAPATFPSRDASSDFQPTEQAIEYVNRIKKRYADDPASYQQFLELLEKFNKSPEDQSQVLQQIVQLFRNAPDLLDEFKLFLPSDGTTQANLLGMFGQIAGDAGIDFDKESQREKLSDKALSSRRKDKSDIPVPEKPPHSPQKRKRKPVDKELPVSKVIGPSKRAKHTHPPPEPSPPPPQSSTHHHVPSPVFAPPYAHVPAPGGSSHAHPPPPQMTQAIDDATFFERVKQFLDNRETYDEFLKVLNLFTQDVVDLRTLVFQTSNFLGDSELMTQFKEIVGWEEKERRDMEGANTFDAPKLMQRPSKADLSIRYGPSYRKLPQSDIHVPCSGRDAMCNSVLNDEWVSHPSWVSEDSGFVAHKKNVYEEALHKSEEERHEYDFYIEAMMKTITVLEPIHTKIMQLSDAERSTFKLKSNWNGQLKSIHQRLLKKIYGREAGLEVVQGLQDSPILAFPVVIQRLKQKEEEWKRAQREWNKVWREVDARNYWKSLDHQGVTFKANDKKAITTKAFVSHIELAREEQLAKRASLIDPSFARTRPRHQLAYTIEDVSVLQDSLKLVLSFLDRTQGQISAHDRKKIENFLRQFVPLFFMFYQREFDSAFSLNDGADSDAIMSDGIVSILGDDDSVSVSGSTRSKNGRKALGGADIRKKLLKTQQQERSGNRRTKSIASAPGSRAPTPPPVNSNGMDVDVLASSRATNGNAQTNGARKAAMKPPRQNNKYYKPPSNSSRKYHSQRGTFFANTTLYVLLRQLHLLYSRLLLCKRLGAQLAAAGEPSSQTVATDSRMQTMPDGISVPENVATAAEYFYGHLLESCEKLFDNVIDQPTFEDTVRFMFGMKAYNVFTLDKVIGALIKQVQMILSDSKNKELVQLLQRERENPSSSTQDQINYRRKAESVVGTDEHLYRINYLQDSRTFTIQLLGKEDVRDDDSPAIIDRWNQYMESYQKAGQARMLDAPTYSNSPKKLPFLRRTMRPEKVTPPTPSVVSHSGLEIQVCMRTYRLFFVWHTEDSVYWRNLKADLIKWNGNAEAKAHKCRKWIELFGEKGWEGVH